jgi:hypothetical protein
VTTKHHAVTAYITHTNDNPHTQTSPFWAICDCVARPHVFVSSLSTLLARLLVGYGGSAFFPPRSITHVYSDASGGWGWWPFSAICEDYPSHAHQVGNCRPGIIVSITYARMEKLQCGTRRCSALGGGVKTIVAVDQSALANYTGPAKAPLQGWHLYHR